MIERGESRDGQVVVRARDLVFGYGSRGGAERRVLDGVSLDFHAGRVHVLMGPNGAGKSSLVRLLAGSRQPDSGVIDVAPPLAGRQAVGLVPQDIALYPWLTAFENCVAFGRILGMARGLARQRAEEALRLTRCDAIAATAVRHLSGGYKRRVNIAAALVGQPLFLILDEPTVGVDLAARRAIAETIEALRETGTAILLVTHDFAEADGLADHVAFLSRGRIVRQGVPRGLVDETFAKERRVEIVLTSPPDASHRAALADWGARPGGSDTHFLAYRAIDGWNATPLATELRALGLDIKELRLRDPGLECLFARVFAQTAEAVAA